VLYGKIKEIQNDIPTRDFGNAFLLSSKSRLSNPTTLEGFEELKIKLFSSCIHNTLKHFLPFKEMVRKLFNNQALKVHIKNFL